MPKYRSRRVLAPRYGRRIQNRARKLIRTRLVGGSTSLTDYRPIFRSHLAIPKAHRFLAGIRRSRARARQILRR